MILVFHLISQDHTIKGPCDFMVGGSLMVSHQPTKFLGNTHCDNGDMMFLVAEAQNSTFFRRHYW